MAMNLPAVAASTLALAVTMMVILLIVGVSGVYFFSKYYSQIVKGLEQQQYVMCCVSNLCKALPNPAKKCQIPDGL